MNMLEKHENINIVMLRKWENKGKLAKRWNDEKDKNVKSKASP